MGILPVSFFSLPQEATLAISLTARFCSDRGLHLSEGKEITCVCVHVNAQSGPLETDTCVCLASSFLGR